MLCDSPHLVLNWFDEVEEREALEDLYRYDERGQTGKYPLALELPPLQTSTTSPTASPSCSALATPSQPDLRTRRRWVSGALPYIVMVIGNGCIHGRTRPSASPPRSSMTSVYSCTTAAAPEDYLVDVLTLKTPPTILNEP